MLLPVKDRFDRLVVMCRYRHSDETNSLATREFVLAARFSEKVINLASKIARNGARNYIRDAVAAGSGLFLPRRLKKNSGQTGTAIYAVLFIANLVRLG